MTLLSHTKFGSMAPDLQCPARIMGGVPDFDTSVPHSARVYDYWLGGKDNFAADREVGDRTVQAYPNVVLSHAQALLTSTRPARTR
jgi:hypothetical protein